MYPVAVVAGVDSVVVIEPDSSIVLRAFYNPVLTYQWYLNDEPVAGEAEHELAVSAEGNYTVQVTNPENQCMSVSAPVEVTSAPTSVAFEELQGVKVYPNPSADVLHVEGLPLAGKMQICLFDSRGVSLYNKSTGSMGSVMIPTRSYPDGMYYLKVIYNQEVLLKKIVVKSQGTID